MTSGATHPQFDEKEYRFAQRMRRKRIIWLCILYPIVGLWWAYIVGIVVYLTVDLITEICGPDAWPSGVFLSLLVLYTIKVLWQYRSPKEYHPDCCKYCREDYENDWW